MNGLPKWDALAHDAQKYWAEIATTLTRLIYEEDKMIRAGLVRTILRCLDNYLYAMVMKCKECSDEQSSAKS